MSAQAANQTVNFVGNAASFISKPAVLAGGADVITFQGVAAGTYDFVLTLSGQGIKLTGATLNGQSGTLQTVGKYTFVGIDGTSSAPFTLDLMGTKLAGKTPLYSGELTIAAVPEAGSLAMVGAGLLTCGFLARRRNKA